MGFLQGLVSVWGHLSCPVVHLSRVVTLQTQDEVGRVVTTDGTESGILVDHSVTPEDTRLGIHIPFVVTLTFGTFHPMFSIQVSTIWTPRLYGFGVPIIETVPISVVVHVVSVSHFRIPVEVRD